MNPGTHGSVVRTYSVTCEPPDCLWWGLKDHPESVGLDPDFQDPVSTTSVFGLNHAPGVPQLLIRHAWVQEW